MRIDLSAIGLFKAGGEASAEREVAAEQADAPDEVRDGYGNPGLRW
jgi:hypothetical protein